jgi:hypothetical protein
MPDKKCYVSVFVLALLAYFVSYPEDAQAITTPINTVLNLIHTVLNLTTAISPWFYGVVAIGIIATAMVKTWGGRAGT